MGLCVLYLSLVDASCHLALSLSVSMCTVSLNPLHPSNKDHNFWIMVWRLKCPLTAGVFTLRLLYRERQKKNISDLMSSFPDFPSKLCFKCLWMIKKKPQNRFKMEIRKCLHCNDPFFCPITCGSTLSSRQTLRTLKSNYMSKFSTSCFILQIILDANQKQIGPEETPSPAICNYPVPV